MSQFRRLHIIAEGQTEEKFVKKVLAMYFGQFNISTDVRCVLTSRDRRKSHRGGLINYQKAKNDIVFWLKEDANPDARFTTMFDLYALPSDFPRYEEAKRKYADDPYGRVSFLETAFKEDISDSRFLPYIQLHEFEALILSKPEALQFEYFERDAVIKQLVELLEQKGNPELINDKPETAPSKQILRRIPEYDKVNVGAAIAERIGIDWLEKHCRHFGDWLDTVKKL